MDKLLNRV